MNFKSLYSNVLIFCLFFFSTADVWAQAADMPAQLSPLQRIIAMSPMFLMVFLIFYLLVYQPQKKQAKTHDELINSLKKGEFVVTSAGIIGRVAGIEKDYILLEVSANTKVKVEQSHVLKRRENVVEPK